jgi:hypothetical protein
MQSNLVTIIRQVLIKNFRNLDSITGRFKEIQYFTDRCFFRFGWL